MEGVIEETRGFEMLECLTHSIDIDSGSKYNAKFTRILMKF